MQVFGKGSHVRTKAGTPEVLVSPVTSQHGRIHLFICESGVSIDTKDLDLAEHGGVWFWEEYDDEIQ